MSLSIEYRNIDDLIPYVNNSRTHSDEQVTQIASSIKEFGFTNPILIDEQGGVIAGHGRIMACKKLGLEQVPTITLVGLSDAQKKAYVIADNKLALNADWDFDLLRVEIEQLQELDFDISLTGFDIDELDKLLDVQLDEEFSVDSQYTDKIATPIYDIKGEKPELQDLYNKDKYENLIREIEKQNLPSDIHDFLMQAATRHIRFNYEKIAEYYANCTDDIKQLFEKSALVIIDYDQAIENGYIQLSEKLMQLSKKDER